MPIRGVREYRSVSLFPIFPISIPANGQITYESKHFKPHNVCNVLGVHRLQATRTWLLITDVPDIRFRLAGYPAIFSNPVPAPVPAKMVPGTGYLSRIVLSPFCAFRASLQHCRRSHYWTSRTTDPWQCRKTNVFEVQC